MFKICIEVIQMCTIIFFIGTRSIERNTERRNPIRLPRTEWYKHSIYWMERHNAKGWLVISVYLLSLPAAHLSDAPKTVSCYGDSARIQDETTESSGWFFNVLGV